MALDVIMSKERWTCWRKQRLFQYRLNHTLFLWGLKGLLSVSRSLSTLVINHYRCWNSNMLVIIYKLVS